MSTLSSKTTERKGLDAFLEQIQSPPKEKEKPSLREPNEHDKLVEIGRNYLAPKSQVVITEIVGNTEEPDVLAYDGKVESRVIEASGESKYPSKQQRGTILLECKASRSDFLSDQKKMFRWEPKWGVGEYRYYFTFKGLLSPDEIPDGWGLIETTGARCKIIKASKYWSERNVRVEQNLLLSAMRRLDIKEGPGISIRVFTHLFKSKNKATVTINQGAIMPRHAPQTTTNAKDHHNTK